VCANPHVMPGRRPGIQGNRFGASTAHHFQSNIFNAIGVKCRCLFCLRATPGATSCKFQLAHKSASAGSLEIPGRHLPKQPCVGAAMTNSRHITESGHWARTSSRNERRGTVHDRLSHSQAPVFVTIAIDNKTPLEEGDLIAFWSRR